MGACVLESLCRILVFLIVSLLFKMVLKQLESLTSVIRDKTHAPMQSSVILKEDKKCCTTKLTRT